MQFPGWKRRLAQRNVSGALWSARVRDRCRFWTRRHLTAVTRHRELLSFLTMSGGATLTSVTTSMIGLIGHGLTPQQLLVASIIGSSIGDLDFALAGGAALIAKSIVNRGTEDLDFFGPSPAA